MVAPDVVFHFDPLCPWTWMTSRWLTEVTAARSLTLGFGALSLRVVNEIPEGQHAGVDASFAALRVIEALAMAEDHEAAARFYRALGERVHRGQQEASLELFEQVLADSDVSVAGAFGDPAWDPRVIEATGAVVDLAGGGVGSPVISWPAPKRAMAGPIVSPPPTGADALRLWDVVTTAVDLPGFYELKKGRQGKRPEIP
jgi:hypothetical protein